MRHIYPTGAGPLDTLDDVATAYAYPNTSDGRPWLRANMVTSLDGAAQGPDGRSGTLSSPADRAVFALLRALADVIIAGAGTARAEHYGPASAKPEFAELRQRAGQPPTPPIAVVSRSLDFDPSAPLFTEAERRTIVLTVDAAPAERRETLARTADVVVAGGESLEVDVAMDALAERGHTRLLCEGGPHLLASLMEAGRVDELCYTMTPVIVGGRADRLVETPAAIVSGWTLGHIIEEDGTLLMRWNHATSG